MAMPSYLPSYAFLTAVLCISILPKTDTLRIKPL
jgi:hypothetical protein